MMLNPEQDDQLLMLDPMLPAPPPPTQRTLPVDWRDAITLILLLAIMVAGYWVRSAGRNWDDFTHLHPDERFLTDVASRLGNSPLNFPAGEAEKQTICTSRYPAPSEQELEGLSETERAERMAKVGKGGYFDATCSDLNPNNIGFGLYVYGQFPLFTTRVAAETITEVEEAQCVREANGDQEAEQDCRFKAQTASRERYNGVHFVGRMVSSVADTLTILVIFLIGLQLFGRWQGLLAAGLYAFAALPIQLSHFWTVDAFSTLWATLTIYMAVNVLDDRASRPTMFAPLPWIAAAFGAWIWELPRLDEPTMLPLLIYGAVMASVGVTASWAQQQKNLLWLPIGISLGAMLLASALAAQIITILGLGVAVALMLVLALLIFAGLNRIAAYGGTLPWLVAAFGLWIYDALANYTRPSLTPLLIYLIIFTIGAALSSALKQAKGRHEVVFWLLTLGLPLLVWMALTVLVDATSLAGMIAALGLVALMAYSTTYGYRDYLSFGLVFGAALAGRVNIAPLVGLLFLAVLIRTLPIFDRHVFPTERYRLMTRAIVGVLLAGFFTLLAFRFLQPHAFSGPSILGLIPNEGWKQDVGEAQRLVSGAVDIPPNYQWVNRVRWMFPWQNSVLYGMGVAMGLAAWAGVIWSLWIIVRGRRQWTRLSIPAAWIAVYFGWLGGNWVTTMRYFLPIYGALALMASWLLCEIVTRSWKAYNAAQPIKLPTDEWHPLPVRPRRKLLPTVGLTFSSVLVVFVVGYTSLYGIGMTSIYRHLLTRTAVSLWFQENIPGNVGLWIEREDGTYKLQNMDTGIVAMPFFAETITEDDPYIYALTVTTDVEVQSVVLHRVSDPARNTDLETLRVRISKVSDPNVPVLIAERTLETDFNVGYSDFGQEYSIRFDDDLENPTRLPLVPGTKQYQVEIAVLDGGAVTLTRNVSDSVLPITLNHASIYLLDTLTNSQSITSFQLDPADDPYNSNDDLPYTYYLPNQPGSQTFFARATGTISQVEIPHLGDPLGDDDNETLRVEVTGANGELSYGQVTGNFLKERDGFLEHGPTVSIPLEPPLNVVQGQSYTLTITADQPLTTLGTVIATEGDWDDSIPYNACPLPNDVELTRETLSGYTVPTCISFSPYPGYYKGMELYLSAEDDEIKRNVLIDVLDEADYLTISSNRFYDTLSRIPYRWPLSQDYYKALFDGSLGYELVLEWTSYPRVGPFEWKDQILPTDDLPQWLNEYESEEAFTVYDHPAVFVFRKTEDYDPARVRDILSTNTRQYKDVFGGFTQDEVPVNRNVVPSLDASKAPTALMMNESQREANHSGTWSDIFDTSALINENQSAAVIFWWLLMIGMGWLAFPLLFAIFPALPDRGFAVSKLVGWVLVAWLAWVGATLHLGAWSSRGILVCIGILALVSASFGYANRHALRDYLFRRWLHLAQLEVLTLLLFLIFLGVRLGNPDLWHSSFGGEKPMNFAYFNAVLRSEVFPPLDPWFADGYINYYYWGYVLVGAPVKLIGLMPSVAYNLIIPTLFAMTGMGAFTVAYNLVAGQEQHALEAQPVSRRTLYASPWLAGISALMLVAVLGNLDTIRVFTHAVAQVGGWQGPGAYDLTAERQVDLVAEFRTEEGREPSLDELNDIIDDAKNPPIWVSFQYNVTQWRDMTDGFVTGFGRVLDGQPLQIHTHRWYWAPTRVIAELPGSKGHNAITEMPYFTFLYGDLHAHMMAMPLMLLVMLWATAEVLGAGRGLRGLMAAGFSLFLGGLVVGLLRATNTWDLPTFLIFSLVMLTFVAWLAQKRQQREPIPFYHNLRRYLDVSQVLNLWYLLWALPFGALLHSLVWFVRSQAYTAKLQANQIPTQCQSLSQQANLTRAQIPAACKGLLEPQWHLSHAIIWAIGMLVVMIGLYVGALLFFGVRFERRGTLAWIGRLGFFIATSFITVLPFSAYYAGEAGIVPWESDRTPLWAFVDIHGLFLFILGTFLIWQTVRQLKQFRVADLQGLSLIVLLVLMGVPFLLLASLALGLFVVPVMLVTLPMMAWTAGLFLLPQTSPSERMVYAMLVLALGIATGVELVVLDVDIGRQNTVFKFYMQIWLLLGVSGGVALAWLVQSLQNWNPFVRMGWQTVLVLLLTVALLYPVMATQARWLDRFNADETPLTLDGTAYMKHAVYGQNGIWFNMIGDYNMIQWLEENIEGTPTIIEAQSVEYQWGSRIAINTGLPTIVGWNFHQRQQRNILSLNSLVWNRSNNVAAFYNTAHVSVAWDMIEFYDLEYIIVGTLERIQYNDLLDNPVDGTFTSGINAGIAKFDRMVEMGLLEVVYDQPSCVIGSPLTADECSPDRIVHDKIYRVVPGADYQEEEAGG